MNRFEQQIISALGKSGEQWLQRLPNLVQRLAQKWNLDNLTVFENLSWNYVAHGIQNQKKVVLKVSYDSQSLNREVQALSCFSNKAAVGVIKFDPLLNSVLLEEAYPGKDLMNHPDSEAIPICCEMVTRIRDHQTHADFAFDAINDVSSVLEKDWFLPKEMLSLARNLKNELSSREGNYVIHGDLHRGNILSNGTDWKVIDPKGFIGTIYDEVWPFIHNPELEIPIVATKLGLNSELLLKYCFVRSMVSAAWGCEDGIETAHILKLAQNLYSLLD